jgi:hypothetical protein
VSRELKDQEKMNRMGLLLQHLLRHADEGEDKLNKIITWGRIMGASLTTRIKACLNTMEKSQFIFNQKVYGYEYAISWEVYVYGVFGFTGSTVSPFQEAW